MVHSPVLQAVAVLGLGGHVRLIQTDIFLIRGAALFAGRLLVLRDEIGGVDRLVLASGSKSLITVSFPWTSAVTVPCLAQALLMNNCSLKTGRHVLVPNASQDGQLLR